MLEKLKKYFEKKKKEKLERAEEKLYESVGFIFDIVLFETHRGKYDVLENGLSCIERIIAKYKEKRNPGPEDNFIAFVKAKLRDLLVLTENYMPGFSGRIRLMLKEGELENV